MFKLPEGKRVAILIALFLLHDFFAGANFVYENYGFSFSLSFNFFKVLIFFALLMLYKNSREIGIWIIFCGGAVNFLDRVRFGFVRDYWFVPGINVYNNLPDWVIFAGIILVCRYYLKTKNSWF